MAEYIEREAAKRYLAFGNACPDGALDLLDEVPAADVAPVVHGEWTEQHHDKWDDEWDDTIHWYTYECSKCGAVAMNDYPYCPFCGAKMDGERKGNE